MSEQLIAPQDNYTEQHPNAIEGVELAELAAHATKAEEEQIRSLGQEALFSLVDGTGTVKNIQKQRVQLREQADTKISAIKELRDSMMQDPSAETLAADMATAEKSKFGMYLNEKMYRLAQEVSVDMGDRIADMQEEGAVSIEFSLDSQDVTDDAEVDIDKFSAIRERLASRVAELAGVDIPEDFDSMDFIISMQKSPDKTSKKDMTSFIAEDVANELIKQKGEKGDFGSYEEAYDYFAERGEIDVSELYKAVESVYYSLGKEQ